MRLEGGIWAGRSVVIIGGGPSLKGFDFSRIPSHHKIIGINSAFKHCPQADFIFSEDLRFFEAFGKEVQEWRGDAVWHCLRGMDYERGLKACPKLQIIREQRDDKYWAKDLSALSFSSNSAVGAINLAEILGASVLYLLGLDCRSEGPVVEHFHQDYDQCWDVGAQQVYNWKSDFEHWVFPQCHIPSIWNVINPSYPSAIQCWPTITQDQFLSAS